MTPQRHAALGLFFIAVIGILGYFTLFKTDFSLVGERHAMTVWFPQANGLRQGDAVWVAGMRWGKVEALSYDPTTTDQLRRIRVDLSLDNQVDLFGDHAIQVQEATVLGGKVLAIEPGTIEAGPHDGSEFFGTVQANLMATLGDVVEENREPLRRTIGELQGLITDARESRGVLGALIHDESLRTELESAVKGVRTTFENLDAITAGALAGEGTLGKLLKDEALYEQIRALATDLSEVADDAGGLFRDAREGQGVIGMLVQDQELAGRVRTAVDDIAAITAGLRAGEGSLGALLKERALYDNLAEASQALADGKGTLGALLHERELHDQVVAIADDFKVFSDQLAHGDGSLGKLLRDDDIYVELRKALVTLTGSLEEAREAAPITAFLTAGALGF